MKTETIEWRECQEGVSDYGVTVLLYNEAWDNKIILGYHDSEQWVEASDDWLGIAVEPTHWADVRGPK
jgi:hypothetical protein